MCEILFDETADLWIQAHGGKGGAHADRIADRVYWANLDSNIEAVMKNLDIDGKGFLTVNKGNLSQMFTLIQNLAGKISGVRLSGFSASELHGLAVVMSNSPDEMQELCLLPNGLEFDVPDTSGMFKDLKVRIPQRISLRNVEKAVGMFEGSSC